MYVIGIFSKDSGDCLFIGIEEKKWELFEKRNSRNDSQLEYRMLHPCEGVGFERVYDIYCNERIKYGLEKECDCVEESDRVG